MRSGTPVGFALGLLLLAPPVGCAAPEPAYNGKPLSLWVAQLKDKDPGVRRDAAGALVWFGPKAKDAVGSLIVALVDDDDTVRDAAVLALSAVGKDAVPPLVVALKDKDAAVRSGAASALGGVGPNAREAVGALVGLFHDKEARVRRSAAFAVGQVGAAPESIDPLLALLNDSDRGTRIAAVVSLGGVGPEARAAVEPLRKFLKANPEGASGGRRRAGADRAGGAGSHA